MAFFKAALPKVTHSNGHSELHKDHSSDCTLDISYCEHKSMYLRQGHCPFCLFICPAMLTPVGHMSPTHSCFCRPSSHGLPTGASGSPSPLLLGLPSGQAISACVPSPSLTIVAVLSSSQPGKYQATCHYQVLFPQKGTKVAISSQAQQSVPLSTAPTGWGMPPQEFTSFKPWGPFDLKAFSGLHNLVSAHALN